MCEAIFCICYSIEKRFLSSQYWHFENIMYLHFQHKSKYEIWNSFNLIKNHHKNYYPHTFNSLATVYSIIYMLLTDVRQKRIVFAAMKNKLDKLHHYEQRHIKIRLFTDFIDNIDTRTEKRKWLYMNNKIVKLQLNER